VRLLERLRRFWLSPPVADHPLTEQERRDDRPGGAYDERARATEDFVGSDLDPDDPQRSE
jgi:hypothetical protein